MAINPKVNYFGFNPPFVGGPSGILSRQEDDKLVKNDLLQLLLTRPGERVMMPNFGTELRATVFDQLDNVTIEMLRLDVSEAIAQYEPRISVRSIQFEPDFERHGLAIRIVYVMLTEPAKIQNLDTFINNGGQNG
jgi:phage baseplate assembly protein W